MPSLPKQNKDHSLVKQFLHSIHYKSSYSNLIRKCDRSMVRTFDSDPTSGRKQPFTFIARSSLAL